jgi:GTP cyclohydrolase I
VNAYARRLSLQESLGENVVQALVEHGGARAAYCEVRLVHGCVVARGPRQARSELVTTAQRGELNSAELLLVLSRHDEARS